MQYLRCNKPGCACAARPAARHGPYYRVVRVVDGFPIAVDESRDVSATLVMDEKPSRYVLRDERADDRPGRSSDDVVGRTRMPAGGFAERVQRSGEPRAAENPSAA